MIHTPSATSGGSILSTARRVIAETIWPEGKEMRNQAQRLANIDVLTGVANRRALELALPTAETDPAIAVILFDANNLGQVNKQISHRAGDDCLRDLASTMRMVAGNYGVSERVFRYGGDEFVILAPRYCAESIRQQIERQFGTYLCGSVKVSVSGTIGDTLAEADTTLQARKAERKAQD